MRVVAIIQARMGSTRLPGKVLKDLAGETVLARVLARTRRSKLLDEVVVATSQLPADDVIVRECKRLSAPCFRGEEKDVLDRYHRAAKEFQADAIVRITSDCPLIDPELIDQVVESFLRDKADYASNALVVTFPAGLDVEVLTVEALNRSWRCAQEPYQRTHVTPYVYENPDVFKLVSVTAPMDYSRYRWTLDTAEDLALIQAIYHYFQGCDTFCWRELVTLMENHPELAEMNSQVRQKALHEG